METAAKQAPLTQGGQSAAEPSVLLPLVLEKLNRRRRMHVLDVGPAVPQTLDFLSGFKCRLHIADLLHNLSAAQSPRPSPKALAAHFAESLSMIDAPLDICLLWELPNHLSLDEVRIFNDVLGRYLKAETLAHGYCSLKQTRPVMRHWYGINETDEVVRLEDSALEPAAHAHSQQQLVGAMNAFEVERGALRSEGRVEVILRTARHTEAEALERQPAAKEIQTHAQA